MSAAALVFAGYGLAFATVGSRFVLDRDVDMTELELTRVPHDRPPLLPGTESARSS